MLTLQEDISIPRFESTIKVISEALEEKEREEFTRQKVIKGDTEKNKSYLLIFNI